MTSTDTSDDLDIGTMLAELAGALPPGCFREASERYLEEPRGRFTGHAAVVLAPVKVEQVATVIRAAAAHRVPVVPYGGGTGLVAGQTMPDGPEPVLLSLERMNKIREVDTRDAVILVEAGVVLQDIQSAASEAGFLFPLSMGSEGSCQIGGNLATNAGGVSVLRYGNARALCLGLEAVLPSGEIWHGLKRLRKDNSGYDLRDLLIGAEGTLGVITAASLRLFPSPARVGTGVMAIRDPAAALDLLAITQTRVGEGVSSFELISRQSLDFLAETLPAIRQPFATRPDWAVLVELGLNGDSDPGEDLTAIFAAGEAQSLVSDGVIAASEKQRKEFWHMRESIPIANRKIGAIASHDVSLPLGVVADFITRAGERIALLGPFRINCFGHVGDGNLHVNVFPPPGEARTAYLPRSGEIQDAVHELAVSMGGSFSAEHGVGRLKVTDLERYGDPAALAAMRAIKAALDPLNIMNPGAVLRDRSLQPQVSLSE